MYAIVRTGGKQYRVEEGRSLLVERLTTGEGETAELADVLLIASDGDVTVGTPVIEGARVLAHVDEHLRGQKIIVFKFKSKVRTRKKTGHRQSLTRLTVEQILRPGQEATAAERPKRRPVQAEAEAPAAAEAAVEAAAAPARRPRRRATEPKETPAKRPARRKAAGTKGAKAEPKAKKPAPRKRTPRRKTE
jgi:large subunit ribosomal protein L21